MGAPAFKTYLASIQALIGTLNDTAASLELKITGLRRRVENGDNVEEWQRKLGEHEAQLANTRTQIQDLKDFFVNIKKKWSKPKDRVIGFVRWAPPIGVGVAPHRYMRDLCVVELDKAKFRFMIGNVLSLGTLLFNSCHWITLISAVLLSLTLSLSTPSQAPRCPSRSSSRLFTNVTTSRPSSSTPSTGSSLSEAC